MKVWFMDVKNKQLMRLIRFVAELKKNNYPNCSTFIKKLKDIDLDENIDISCSVKTIQRDIKALKEKFNAPIDFDYEKNGYYLKHHGWDFQAPVYTEDDMLSLVISAKLAEDITPNPLRSQISESIDELLTSNNPDFMDTAVIDSIIASSALNVKINAHIFKIVFQAWKLHKTLNIKYKTVNGEESRRDIDPHVLSYYNKAWYLKAYCHEKESTRVFALHRIVEAELTNYEFDFDLRMLEGVKGAPFKLEEVRNVKLWCSKEIAGYVLEKTASDNRQIVEQNDDGSLILYYPLTSKLDLIRWILAEGGNMKLLEPEYLKDELKQKAKQILKLHS